MHSGFPAPQGIKGKLILTILFAPWSFQILWGNSHFVFRLRPSDHPDQFISSRDENTDSFSTVPMHIERSRSKLKSWVTLGDWIPLSRPWLAFCTFSFLPKLKFSFDISKRFANKIPLHRNSWKENHSFLPWQVSRSLSPFQVSPLDVYGETSPPNSTLPHGGSAQVLARWVPRRRVGHGCGASLSGSS